MLIVLAILFLLTCGLLAMGLYRTSTRYAIRQRLDKVLQTDVQTRDEELEQPFIQRVLLPMGGWWV